MMIIDRKLIDDIAKKIICGTNIKWYR